MIGSLRLHFREIVGLPRHLERPDRASVVSWPQAMLEVAYLWARNGIGPLEYCYAGLFRRSIPWAEKRNFASISWYHEMIDIINPREHRIVAWHKLLTDALLCSFGVPTPRVYGIIDHTGGTCLDGHPLDTPDDLAAMIRRHALDELCFKLVGGWSGKGFKRVTVIPGHPMGVRLLPVGGEMSLAAFWNEHLDVTSAVARSARHSAYGYLCQAVVPQHALLDRLHPESVNTCRVWMYQDAPGRWEMFAAVQRIGTGNTSVDNGGPGGIGAPVDLATGRLGSALRRGRPGVGFATYRFHPDNGAAIEGTTLPLWEDMLPLCRKTCSLFPFFRLMGLDVAFTPEGLVVVEVEADPHATHQAHFGRGVRPLVSRLARDRREGS